MNEKMLNSNLKKIYRYLIGKDIKRTTLGYRYLIDAIWIMMEGGARENYRINDVYRKVAEMNCTSIDCVERDIRNSLRGMHQTCKEFICQAIDEIRFMEDSA